MYWFDSRSCGIYENINDCLQSSANTNPTIDKNNSTNNSWKTIESWKFGIYKNAEELLKLLFEPKRQPVMKTSTSWWHYNWNFMFNNDPFR